MIIKPSTALRNEYAQLSRLAKESQEPIYITKNGEGDLVLMSLEAFEQREQLLQASEPGSPSGGRAGTRRQDCRYCRGKKDAEGADR